MPEDGVYWFTLRAGVPEDGVYWFTLRAGCQRMEYISLP